MATDAEVWSATSRLPRSWWAGLAWPHAGPYLHRHLARHAAEGGTPLEVASVALGQGWGRAGVVTASGDRTARVWHAVGGEVAVLAGDESTRQ